MIIMIHDFCLLIVNNCGNRCGGDGVLFAERANELILCGLPKEKELQRHSESEPE
jgi:hypothetical protein